MSFEIDPRTALNKLAFGPSNETLHHVSRVGVDGWLAEQLKPPSDDDCAQRIATTSLRLKYASKTPEATVDEERPIEVIVQPIEQHWRPAEKTCPGPQRTTCRSALAPSH